MHFIPDPLGPVIAVILMFALRKGLENLYRGAHLLQHNLQYTTAPEAQEQETDCRSLAIRPSEPLGLPATLLVELKAQPVQPIAYIVLPGFPGQQFKLLEQHITVGALQPADPKQFVEPRRAYHLN